MNHEDYESIELQAESILRDLASIIQPSESDEVRRFIDVGEYGLAIETLCGVLKDADYSISQATYQKLVGLAQVMELDQAYWRSIRTT